MKHKTAELTGALLDAAVALAEGKSNIPGEWAPAFINDLGRCSIAKNSWDCAKYFEPHRKWSDAGPIIERERMKLDPNNPGPPEGDWLASFGLGSGGFAYGPTPLVAAMRAYVASKFGDEVDLP